MEHLLNDLHSFHKKLFQEFQLPRVNTILVNKK